MKASIATLCLLSSMSYGQVIGGEPVGAYLNCWPDHLSQLPPAPASCVHQGTALNVLEYSEVTTSYLERDFVVTLAGECGLWVCGQAPPKILANCGYSRSVETCWSVGGAVSAEGKTSLLLRLFGELSITVEINGSFTKCEETGYQAGIQGQIDHCMERDCNIGEEIEIATGTVTEHAERAAWLCTMGDGSILDVATECGTNTSSGEAKRTQRTRIWYGLPRVNNNCAFPCGEMC